MDIYLQATAAVLLAVILILSLGDRNRELALVLTLAACSMTAIVAVRFLNPVWEFLEQLQAIGQLNNEYLTALLKIIGIGFLSEIAALVCADAGNGALGKTLQMLSTCVILWLSIPVLRSLLEMVQEVLAAI